MTLCNFVHWTGLSGAPETWILRLSLLGWERRHLFITELLSSVFYILVRIKFHYKQDVWTFFHAESMSLKKDFLEITLAIFVFRKKKLQNVQLELQTKQVFQKSSECFYLSLYKSTMAALRMHLSDYRECDQLLWSLSLHSGQSHTSHSYS